jgi:glycosyltransferase involved in cell wall biosynthesis
MPRISVIMPVYNCSSYLRESVGSILAQTFSDFELIAVDDGSSDDSWEILQTITDKRVRTICGHLNCGAARARNQAVEHADGEYLAFLDADDLASPARFATQIAALDSKPSIDILTSRVAVTDSTGVIHRGEVFRSVDIGALLLFKNCIVQSSVLMRRACWQSYRSEFEPAEDYDLWARLAPGHRFSSLNDILVTYRRHERGVSHLFPEKMKRAVQMILREQLERLGVAPNEEIHSRLTAWPPNVTVADLAEAEAWLTRLLAANRLYAPESLQRVIEQLWFSICLDSWSLKSKAFRVYSKSRLARLTPARLWHFARRYGRGVFR